MEAAEQMPRKKLDERAPAFQFYWKHYLSDDAVMAMSWAARGIHVHFICIAWQQQPPCTLPDDDDLLRAWVGYPPDWEALKKQVFRAWRFDETGGRWVQDGLRRVHEEQEAYRLSRRKGANARWGSRPATTPATPPSPGDAHAVHTECSPPPPPPPSKTQTRRRKNTPSASDAFDRAWAMYPERPGNSRKEAWKAWSARLAARDATEQEMLAATERYAAYIAATRPEPRFVRLGKTFYGPAADFSETWRVSAPIVPDDPLEARARLLAEETDAAIARTDALLAQRRAEGSG